ncbi:MAG: 4'-phosphopantetheinyl transferase superfamily protein [Clostridia bacterium]|nr:4'-phosphopantetheinyl transferase superfamily protein [Clostridia bacterium]
MTTNSDFIKLYIADVSVLSDPVLFDRALRTATPKRREKIDRLRQEKDKRLSLGAECLLKIALQNEGIESFEYQYGEHGKPYIDDEIEFSISHSGDFAICAISNKDVGCDIEQIGTADLKLAKRFFTQAEYEMLSSSTEDIDTLFFRLWTMKESLIKLTGRGINQPLNSFEVDVYKGKTLYNGTIYHFKEYEIDKNYRCCVCSESACKPTQVNVDLGKEVIG